ncbi:DUF6470 family protein [Paenibacillus sp. D51F]
MSIAPIVQIRQTPALIGIDADLGQYSIEQKPADLQMKTTPGELSIRQFAPELQVDSTAAREAITGGGLPAVLNRIYSGIQQLYLEGIANRMEQGSRMAAIYNPSNTIADIVGTDNQPAPFPETRGPASIDNVDISFTIRPPEISVSRASSELHVEVHRPDISYARGKLDIYMKQYPGVQFIPPEIDVLK